MIKGERTSIIRNMSAPPKSVVKYAGLADLGSPGKQEGAGGSSVAGQAGVFGTAVRFALPAHLLRKEAFGILRHLGMKPGPDPDRELHALIDQRAQELPLPDGCLVIPQSPYHRIFWPDALSALAILAKCSAFVWLKAKTPSLTSALAKRSVSLLVPPNFAARLPEVSS